MFGTVEELDEKAVRDIIDTNLFGALWITQAALPIMRAQGSGHSMGKLQEHLREQDKLATGLRPIRITI